MSDKTETENQLDINASDDENSAGKNKKEVSLYKGFAFTSVGSIINIIALFAEAIIAVRLLAKVDYGIYVLLITVTNFVIMATDFGCKISVTQLIASGKKDRQAVLTNSVMALRILICLVMSALVWFGQGLLVRIDPTRGLLLYAAAIPAMYIAASIEQLLGGILKGFKQYDAAAIAQSVRSLTRVVLSIGLLVFFQLGIWALVYSWIISFALSAIYQYIKLPVSKRWTLNPPAIRDVLRFGFPIQLSAFLWYVSWQVHILLLSTLAGPASVALFDVANKIPSALHRFSESYISIFFPTMSSLLADKRYGQASWMLEQSLRLSSFVIGIGVLFSVLFSREIMGLLFSSEYAGTASAFSLLMVAFHMTFLVHLLGYTLTSAGYPEKSLVENSVRAVLSSIAGVLLIPIFNFLGAAVGQLIANYAANPVALWLMRQTEIKVNVAPFVKQTAILLIFCIVGWFIGDMNIGLASSISSRLGMIVLFIVSSFMLSTVSQSDLHIVLPKSIIAKLGIRKPELSNVL